MRRTLAIVATALALAVVTIAGPSASAITFGTVDSTNIYANVGALVGEFPGIGRRVICSGTLIEPDVFLTATHCVVALEANGSTQTYVSFSPTFDPNDTAAHLPGTAFAHPEYGQPGADVHDIAVVVLDDPVAGIDPAELVPLNYLTERKSGLKDERFDTAGYGRVRNTKKKGPSALLPSGGVRSYVDQGFLSLQKPWLTLSMNPSTGSGGSCFGDSGGPHFHDGLIVSITVTGDSVCRATDTTYRVDTRSARAFLDDFVDLP
ncbi:MAG: trypsin-like serine protease [Actinomycetota bacterium]